MTNFFLIHASDETSQTHWTPWLKSELIEAGYETIAPDFPCEDGHILSRWYDVMEKYMDKISEDTIFVGHSRGFPFVLNLLMDYDIEINSLYGVGGFIDYIFYPKPEGGLDTFFARPFDFERIKKRCKHFVDYESNNDPYIPIEMAKKIEKELNSRIVIIPDAKHFRDVDGYKEFPELLEDLLTNARTR